MNFIPTSVRPAGSIKTAAMLVRGVDRYQHFEPVQPPKAELDAASVAAHERATTLYRTCYLEEEARHARLSVSN